MLDMNRLRVLYEVDRSGSFSAAAKVLRITPSAVSQQVAALERSVGLDVVERSPRGVRVTEPGRLLVEATADVLAGLTQVERRLEDYAAGTVGRLAIATFPSAGQVLLPRALAPLTGRRGVELTVADAEPTNSVPMVLDGAVDLALVYHFFDAEPPHEWRSRLTYTPLVQETIYALIPERHGLAEQDVIPLSALAEEAWIQGVDQCGQDLEWLCLMAGFRQRAACRSGDYGFVKTMVASGVGVALVPSLGVPPPVEGTRLVELESSPKRYVGLVRRRETKEPPLATELVTRLRQTAAELGLLA